ncbi:hypothetical protein P7K49_023543, partial [Saguinus oedipus]
NTRARILWSHRHTRHTGTPQLGGHCPAPALGPHYPSSASLEPWLLQGTDISNTEEQGPGAEAQLQHSKLGGGSGAPGPGEPDALS